MRATAHVYTFKEGFLARLAHDLRLTVGKFEIHLERSKLRASFAADSLRVDGVARPAGVDAGALSADDKADIEDTIRRVLLQSAAHPQIEVHGTLTPVGEGFAADVEVRLRGVTQRLRVPIEIEPDRTVARVELAPSHFGIAPYKALAGAIRLQDRVVVSIEFLEQSTLLENAARSGDACMFEPA